MNLTVFCWHYTSRGRSGGDPSATSSVFGGCWAISAWLCKLKVLRLQEESGLFLENCDLTRFHWRVSKASFSKIGIMIKTVQNFLFPKVYGALLHYVVLEFHPSFFILTWFLRSPLTSTTSEGDQGQQFSDPSTQTRKPYSDGGPVPTSSILCVQNDSSKDQIQINSNWPKLL